MSGGLDSTVTAYYAKSQGYEIYALTFDYGQKNRKEVRMAKKAASELGVREHKILDINLDEIGGSALTDTVEVPEVASIDEINEETIPPTYVPARNTIFLSYALAYAEVKKVNTIFIGVNFRDYSGYPDCRPAYIKAFQKMANLATKRTVKGKTIEIKTPLIRKKKSVIVKLGRELDVPFEATWSCYRKGGKACGKCEACLLRLQAFNRTNIKDPIEYKHLPEEYT